MKNTISIIITFLSVQLLSTANALASEPAYKYLQNYYTYTVNPDGAFTLVVENAKKLLKEDAVKASKQQTVSYSTSVEKRK